MTTAHHKYSPMIARSFNQNIATETDSPIAKQAITSRLRGLIIPVSYILCVLGVLAGAGWFAYLLATQPVAYGAGRVILIITANIIVVLGLIALLRPMNRILGTVMWITPWRFVTLIAFILLAPANYAMAWYQVGDLQPNGVITGDDKHVVLEPDTWLHWPLALAEHIDMDPELKAGTWSVLLYDPTDENVDQLIATLHQLARPKPESTPEYRYQLPAKLACIATTANVALPYEEDVQRRVGHLDPATKWIIDDTPVLLTVKSGLVMQILMGEQLPTTVRALEMKLALIEPSLAFTEPVDIGYVEPGSACQAVFTLCNPTEEPIEIVDAVSGCSCMWLLDELTVLEPGSTIEVPVGLNAPDESRLYAKKITLYTDHPDHPRIELAVSARVGLPADLPTDIDIEIDSVITSSGSDGMEWVRVGMIPVSNDGLTPIRLLYATTDDPAVRVRASRITIEGEGEVEIPIEIKVETLGETLMRDVNVNIRTNVTGQREMNTTVRLSRSPS